MRSIQSLLGVTGIACAAACAQAPPAPAPPPAPLVVDTVLIVDTVRIETEAAANVELEDRVARLQIQVLEKDVQLEELQAQFEATRLELVRNMARLQSQSSRAEAVSGMAEAEIALAALRRAPGGDGLPEFEQADDLLAQSSTEFNDENYGGALYLATQVRLLVRSGQARLRGGAGGTLRAGESLFAVPVPFQTVGRSNVRSGPGLNFAVQFTLDGSAPVVGQSHTSQWVRIVDDEGREGWIFNTLVTSR